MSGSTKESGQSGTRPASTAADEVRQAFAGLPLDQKISTLIQVEVDMLGDAVNSVVSAVSKLADDVAKTWDSSEPSGSATSSAGEQPSTT